ncbi:MAG: hypothetical protein ABIS51_02855 [Sphingomonas sp.]
MTERLPSTGEADRADDDDIIDELPMTVREFDLALAPYLTRTDRRRFWRGLGDAELIVFRS